MSIIEISRLQTKVRILREKLAAKDIEIEQNKEDMAKYLNQAVDMQAEIERLKEKSSKADKLAEALENLLAEYLDKVPTAIDFWQVTEAEKAVADWK